MMQLFSTFEHSIKLELAISALELRGIDKENILAVPLTEPKVDGQLFDTIHRSDGITFIGTGAAIGTAFSVIGSSVGFRLAWGPVYWGLIAAASGFLLGFLIDLFILKVLKKGRRALKTRLPQVILIVACDERQADAVETVLWHCLALGTARICPQKEEK